MITIIPLHVVMKRTVLGFTLRLIAALVISLVVWWLATTPFDRLLLPRHAVIRIVRILDFPVALAGELLYPIRGMELVFRDYDTWCDFCSIEEMLRQQMRVAIPTYLFLIYIPTLLRAVARRNTRLFRRIIIGLLIYTVTIASFLITGDRIGRGDVRIATIFLLILSGAAAFTWSQIRRSSKTIAVVAVLLVGAWALRFVPMDGVQPGYLSYLLLLILGVGGTLWLTWAGEDRVEWWQRRRIEN